MRTNKRLTLLTTGLGLLLTSCDPTYPITITNAKKDTVTIVTETTIDFHTDDTLIEYQYLGGPYDHKIIKFKMAPGKSIECGTAIAGIEDELPFTKFKVHSNKDSFVAESPDKILNLFEKTFWGYPKTPYQLTVR